MVPAHGRPVAGNANIAELLTAYRDAIAFTHDQAVRFINKGYTPDELAALPLENLLQFLTVRVAAEKCFDAHHLIALHFTPDQKTYVLELRHGVMQIHASTAGLSGDRRAASVSSALPERVSATLSLTRAALIALGRGTPFIELAAQGTVSVTSGKPQALAEFFLCLDPQPKHPPKLASR